MRKMIGGNRKQSSKCGKPTGGPKKRGASPSNYTGGKKA